MNLYSQQLSFWVWFFKVFFTFFKARPLATAVVVITTSLAQVTSLLSTLLPLKIILLAGSEGVPRYFAFFIEPAEKGNWIIILSVATVGAFIATSIFETVSRKLSQSVSGEVLETANELIVFANQEKKATSYYSRFCSVISNLIFVLLCFVMLKFINFELFFFLMAAVIIELVASSIMVTGDDSVVSGKLKNFVVNKLGDYLGTLKLINFLGGFFVILYPFLVGPGYNILFAILSMVLLRQALNMLSSFVSDSVGLAKARHRVNTLVFRNFQLEQKERSLSVLVRDTFPNHERVKMAALHINSEPAQSRVESTWVDSTVPTAITFKLTFGGDEEPKRCYLQLAFPAGKKSRLDNEFYLFEHVSRSCLNAPNVVTRFAEGSFECLIYDYGKGELVPDDQWIDCEKELLTNLWSYQPPAALVEAYAASHPSLDKLFKEEFISRVVVAIDTELERQVFNEFVAMMPSLSSYLSCLPLYIFNPDLKPGNVVVTEDENNFLIMTWARWQILPLGAVFPKRLKRLQLDNMLLAVRDSRKDVSGEFSVDDIYCSNLSYELERSIRGERYKAALEIMCSLIKYRDFIKEKNVLQLRSVV